MQPTQGISMLAASRQGALLSLIHIHLLPLFKLLQSCCLDMKKIEAFMTQLNHSPSFLHQCLTTDEGTRNPFKSRMHLIHLGHLIQAHQQVRYPLRLYSTM